MYCNREPEIKQSLLDYKTFAEDAVAAYGHTYQVAGPYSGYVICVGSEKGEMTCTDQVLLVVACARQVVPCIQVAQSAEDSVQDVDKKTGAAST